MNKYERTCEFLYAQMSNRVSRLKKANKLTNADLIENNPPLVSDIVHNRRTPNNRFLIPETRADEISQAFGITSAELYWGNMEEQSDYSMGLFKVLAKDIFDNGGALNDCLTDALIDVDVEFARNIVYIYGVEDRDGNEYHFHHDEIWESEDDLFVNQDKALERFYFYVYEDFNRCFATFFQNLSAKKLPKNMAAFVEGPFAELLKDTRRRSCREMGRFAFNVISQYLLMTPSETELARSGEVLNHEYGNCEAMNTLRFKTHEYIDFLRDLQQQPDANEECDEYITIR